MDTDLPPTALVIRPNGVAVSVPMAGDSLEFLQRHVGGFVVPVDLRSPSVERRITAWVNEDAIAEELPVNLVGSAVGRAIAGDELYQSVFLGPVVFTGFDAVPDETRPLTSAELHAIVDAWQTVVTG